MKKMNRKWKRKKSLKCIKSTSEWKAHWERDVSTQSGAQFNSDLSSLALLPDKVKKKKKKDCCLIRSHCVLCPSHMKTDVCFHTLFRVLYSLVVPVVQQWGSWAPSALTDRIIGLWGSDENISLQPCPPMTLIYWYVYTDGEIWPNSSFFDSIILSGLHHSYTTKYQNQNCFWFNWFDLISFEKLHKATYFCELESNKWNNMTKGIL